VKIPTVPALKNIAQMACALRNSAQPLQTAVKPRCVLYLNSSMMLELAKL
jgi:hypothetical protein